MVRKSHLSLKTFCAFVPQMLETNPEFIGFAGMGEPLMNPMLAPMIYGLSDKAKTFITTNGQLLTKDKAVDLWSADLAYAVVSVHTCRPELYEQLMFGCSFKKMVKNIEDAIYIGLDIKMQVIVSDATKDHLGETYEFAKSLGCSEVYWALLHNRGGNLAASTRTIPGPGKCDIFNNTMFIDSAGIIRSCSNDLQNTTDYGSSIAAALEMRQALPALCADCNDSMRDLATVHSDLRANGVKQEWIGPI